MNTTSAHRLTMKRRSDKGKEMVEDSKAEELEAKRLYRRAASRWLEVLERCVSENEREWIASRRSRCIDLARLPPQQAENFGSLSRAAKETQHRMGIAQPGGEAFRLPGKKK